MAQLQSPPEPPSDAERIAALQARNAELELELQQVEERLHKQAEASTDLLSQVYDVTDRNHLETERRESQQLLQGILNTAPVGIFLKDLQGQYILVNPYWLKTMGLTQEQALGKTDYELFLPEIAREIAKRDRAVLDIGEAVTYEEVIPNPDKTRTYITKRFPLYDVAGNPYAVCGISTDISDRKRMEEELCKLNIAISLVKFEMESRQLC
jgi:PAS domain S-box-containing protein